MIIILMGPPGAGKGTGGSLMLEEYKLYNVSMGDLLRERMKTDDEIGRQIASIISTGELCPDDMINVIAKEVIEKTAKSSDFQGTLFDGYPRTLEQAKSFDEMLKSINMKVDIVINIELEDDAIVSRIESRRIDRSTGATYNLLTNPPPPGLDLYQRDDDKGDIVRKRLSVYKTQTEPILEHYRTQGLVKSIRGDLKLEDMKTKLVEIISPFVG